MHAADPEAPPGVDCAVIQPHAGAIIHQGERAQGLGLEIVGCNLAPGGNDEIAGTPKPQRRYGGFRSIGFQLLRRRMPAMNVLILDKVHPVEPLLGRIPPWTFADHVASPGYIFRFHGFNPFCWCALESKDWREDLPGARCRVPAAGEYSPDPH